MGSVRLTNDGESIPEKWITYMDPINEALNTPAESDLLRRLTDTMREFNYYTQAIDQLRTMAHDEKTNNSYMAATIVHNAIVEVIKQTYTKNSAISKYPKTYMVYELLFIFAGALPMLSEIDEILHECGITVLNAYGDSPDLTISRNLTWYPETDYYTEEEWRDIENDLNDEDDED